MTMNRSMIAVCATLGCLSFAWATGAGRPHPASAGGVIDPSCTSSLPCIEYDNGGTGPGIRGISVSGNGVGGSTQFNGTSTTSARAGVLGVDQSVSGSFNSGVKGTSTRGIGVSGVSNGRSFPAAGVTGLLGAPSGILPFELSAVYADSQNGSGVLATSANASAVVAVSANAEGVNGITDHKSLSTGTGQAGVIGQDSSVDGGHLNTGVLGSSRNGIGVAGFSQSLYGVEAESASTSNPALVALGNGVTSPTAAGGNAVYVENNSSFDAPFFSLQRGSGPLLEFDSSGGAFITGDSVGNLRISGKIFTAGSCASGCTAGPNKQEHRVVSYVPRESAPTMEDFGEGQLVNGATYIRLDSAFANVIDSHASYLVFITPEGDANVLYVTQKSAAGFSVRETHGGRSTIAFSYRIVAKPFGSREARLPMVELPRLRSGSPKQTRRFRP